MNMENRFLFMDEPVKFWEITGSSLGFQKITNGFEGNYGMYLELIKKS